MAELALCERLGIAHSHFLGGPASWTAQDREKALAFAAYKATVCHGCGTTRAEWDPGQGGHEDAYIGGVDQCPGCVVLAQEARNVQEQAKDRPDAADGTRPVLRHRSTFPTDDEGNVIDGE